MIYTLALQNLFCSAGLVEEVEVGKGRVVRITGIQNKGRTSTVLLRGSNKLVSRQGCLLHHIMSIPANSVQHLSAGGVLSRHVTSQLSAKGPRVHGDNRERGLVHLSAM
jgi:chaperonin GroEL (HSP60 family)